MTEIRRGYIILAFGVLFPIVFLIGGGVIGSTFGGYMTTVFAGAFAVGLLVPGIIVYQSAKQRPTSVKVPSQQKWFAVAGVMVMLQGVCLILWQMFFQSDLFATMTGQLAFAVLMGFALSVFIPLGLGTIAKSKSQKV